MAVKDDDTQSGTDTNSGPDTQTSVDALVTKVEEAADEIATTPDEDKDAQWRKELTSTLQGITTQLTELSKQTGASAEVTALTQEVRELKQALETQAQSRPSSSAVEDAPPPPETPKVTSSETPTAIQSKPTPEPAPQAKPRRAKAWV